MPMLNESWTGQQQNCLLIYESIISFHFSELYWFILKTVKHLFGLSHISMTNRLGHRYMIILDHWCPR